MAHLSVQGNFLECCALVELAIREGDEVTASQFVQPLRDIRNEVTSGRASGIWTIQIVRLNYTLGAEAMARGEFAEALEYLMDALRSARNSRELEMEVKSLLQLARLAVERTDDADVAQGTKHTRDAEAFVFQAVVIAGRGGYRLLEADAHNFLATLNIARGELRCGRGHAERAKELALCGVDPTVSPYYYSHAYTEAKRVLSELAA